MHNFWLDIRSDAVAWTRHALPRLVVVLFLAFVLLQLLRIATRRLVRFSENISSTERAHQMRQLRTVARIINSVGIAVIFFLAAMQLLPLFGIDMKPLLASAGIAGLAIGFGAQTLVKDVINGFFILVEDQYHIGDMVHIAGVKGIVEDMTLRRTVLRDPNGTLHFVPSGKVEVVSNLTRDWTELSLHVAVDYSENSDRVIKALSDVATELRNDPHFSDVIVAEPQVAGIERVTGAQVDYLLLVKTRPGQHHGVSRELRRRIKECFEKERIKIAAPTRVMTVSSEGGQESESK